MKYSKEYTSLEYSIKLFDIGVRPDCEEKYYWQKISSTEYQKQFQDQGESLFVGNAIQQGSTALYDHIEIMCPAYTFQQLFDFLGVCPPLKPKSLTAVDQLAQYIIQIRT